MLCFDFSEKCASVDVPPTYTQNVQEFDLHEIRVRRGTPRATQDSQGLIVAFMIDKPSADPVRFNLLNQRYSSLTSENMA